LAFAAAVFTATALIASSLLIGAFTGGFTGALPIGATFRRRRLGRCRLVGVTLAGAVLVACALAAEALWVAGLAGAFAAGRLAGAGRLVFAADFDAMNFLVASFGG